MDNIHVHVYYKKITTAVWTPDGTRIANKYFYKNTQRYYNENYSNIPKKK